MGKFVSISNGVVPYSNDPTVPANSDCDPQGDNFAWAIIKDASTVPNNVIFVVNTHLTNDENGTDCAVQRAREVKQLHQQVNSLDSAHYPVVVMGDLNVDNDETDGEQTLSLLGQSSGASAGTSYEHWYNLDPSLPLTNNGTTYNTGWVGENDAATDTKRIDYIWAGTKFTFDMQSVDKTGYVYGGYSSAHSPSDHYPVFARLSLTP